MLRFYSWDLFGSPNPHSKVSCQETRVERINCAYAKFASLLDCDILAPAFEASSKHVTEFLMLPLTP
jgi:hypothetical protein